MSAIHTHDMPASQPLEHGDPATPRSSTSPWLWAALILALLAATLLWLRPAGPGETTVPAIGEQAAPAITPQAPMAAEPGTSAGNTAARKPVPALRNRDARPLAGNAKPSYPPAALRSGVEGGVVARLDIDAQGQVTAASIVSRHGQRSRDLDRAVLDSVRGWKFEPALRDGHSVASVVQVPVDFRANQ
ncbi:energy transducer TonB [Stenotrophomonas sp. NLF4-10]|uniref:energy transducer TonB n=1 Tax=Stenotrophomonas sp. NLF4-10 TaxID=2918754 RepID=UPI001EFB4BB8|nr:energy transducer TonB [Stenotrophomonas sp. NLF4-10]MCG8277032.1 energy transducer TonB [Stenotrophomonas sp. NLF4-10]